MTKLKAIGKALLTGLVILLKACLLLPIPAFMLWFNFTVDRSGIFHGDRYNREMALALIDGQVLNEYDKIDERGIYELLAQNIDQPYDTLALGSSRVLMIRHEMAGNGSFMNCGLSGADIYDLLGTWYLFDEAGMIPENLIIAPDPWLLNGNDPRNPRSNLELYNAFLSQRLGMDAGFAPPDNTAQLSALISPSYFQGNLEYYFSDKSGEEKPPIVTGDPENQSVNIKLGDGSVMYPPDYRNTTGEELEIRMRTDINTFLIRAGYITPDAELTEIYRRFIEYIHGLGVNISIVLPPYSPLVYDYATENRGQLEGVFAAEEVYREVAAEFGIPVYGSYNPYVNDFDTADFYDGLHPKPEAVARIYPGVEQAARDQSAPYQWQPYGGSQVSYATAERLVAQRYEIAPPEVTRQGEDEQVKGQACYVVERYDKDGPWLEAGETLPAGENAPVRLARYAVTREEGVVYRYDDDAGWMVDLRFPG